MDIIDILKIMIQNKIQKYLKWNENNEKYVKNI